MSGFFKRALLRANYEFKRVSRKPFASQLCPFQAPGVQPKIIHCCYHKVGTVWFGRILREVAAEFGMTYASGDTYSRISEFEEGGSSEVFLDFGSHVDLSSMDDYVGSHMVRDPRDIVVSGYFYHLWTKEPWANIPMAEYSGRTYKEHLNNLALDEGLETEIRRLEFWVPHMANWKFNNPKIYEIRYEEIILDDQRVFLEMFRHYGFTEKAIERCCQVAEKYSFRNMSGNNKNKRKKSSHLRSGKSGEWKEYFKPQHKQLFKELYPGAVSKLGYERDELW